ncbi:MAG: hypothetical protein M3022_19505 [Actinomycetota bacterium]|nr:hypothetical protein [Actinomycetota bacterium]
MAETLGLLEHAGEGLGEHFVKCAVAEYVVTAGRSAIVWREKQSPAWASTRLVATGLVRADTGRQTNAIQGPS